MIKYVENINLHFVHSVQMTLKKLLTHSVLNFALSLQQRIQKYKSFSSKRFSTAVFECF